jgi:NADH dehydrogenase/NADH:ubiquinone oxidoreductase subunit G
MNDDSLWFRPPPRPSRPPVPPEQPEPATVGIVIDGQAVSVPATWTILDACRSLRIDTPTLCHLENLTPVNVCRICVVELAGARTLVPACSRRVEPEMEIRTDSPRVRQSRKMVIEFLASSVDLSTAPRAQE